MLKTYLFSIFITFISTFTFSQTNTSQRIGFTSDNDLYSSITLDRYYTNGLEIYFQKATKKDSLQLSKRIHTLKVGQKIYNPIYSYLYTLSKIDRPYAGTLYVQYAQNILKSTYFLEIGGEFSILGPNSFAEDAQNFIHTFYNIKPSKGWDNQVSEKIGGGFFINSGCVIIRNKQLESSVMGNIVTTNINTNVGMSINQRINLTSKGLNQFNQTILNQSNIDNYTPTNKEFFLNSKANITYQFNDATVTHPLENPLKQKEFSIIPWMFTEDIGIFTSSNHWDFSYHVIWYTKNVKSMTEFWNRYGSIQLAYKF